MSVFIIITQINRLALVPLILSYFLSEISLLSVPIIRQSRLTDDIPIRKVNLFLKFSPINRISRLSDFHYIIHLSKNLFNLIPQILLDIDDVLLTP